MNDPTDFTGPTYEEVAEVARRFADLVDQGMKAGYGPIWNAAVVRKARELRELLNRAFEGGTQ